MTASVELYNAMVRATDEQRLRIGGQATGFARWDRASGRFRADPHRELDENLQLIAQWLGQDDGLLDVGGGGGRYCLPMASRCREVIDIDPSEGMQREFEASAAEAGIKNARFVRGDWLTAPEVQGDVSLVVHVTYFVPDIEPFIAKLVRCSRKRVIIGVGSVPPPNQAADLSTLVNGEPQPLVPGQRELLPVLWDMGILPEVYVGGGAGMTGIQQRPFATREEAINGLFRAGELDPEREARTRRVADEHFDALFVPSEQGFLRRPGRSPRLMLITWAT